VARLVFVDESGDPYVSPTPLNDDFYVITAMIADSDRPDLLQAASQVVQEHAGSGELKSSKVGSNLERRIRILRHIAEHRFFFYSLVVQKRSIFQGSGIQYRGIFYKFLHRLFYSRIRRGRTQVRVVTDKHGSNEFMEGFNRYIQDRAGLFESHRFACSADEPALQLADVIAGSVRRVAEGKDPKKLLAVLPGNLLICEHWPWLPGGKQTIDDQHRNRKFDALVKDVSLRAVSEFVEKNQDSRDELIQLQVLTALLLMQTMTETGSYLHRCHLCQQIQDVRSEQMSEQILTSNVLAPLRDAGIPITSTDQGVKLPSTAADIHDHFERAGSQIVPYVKRLASLRNTMLMESMGELDVATDDRHPELWRLIMALSGDSQLTSP